MLYLPLGISCSLLLTLLIGLCSKEIFLCNICRRHILLPIRLFLLFLYCFLVIFIMLKILFWISCPLKFIYLTSRLEIIRRIRKGSSLLISFWLNMYNIIEGGLFVRIDCGKFIQCPHPTFPDTTSIPPYHYLLCTWSLYNDDMNIT